LKFSFGEIPRNTKFDFSGYQILEEPAQNKFKSLSFLVLVMMWASFFWVWSVVVNDFESYFSTISLMEVVFIFIVMVPVHEALHGIFYPLRDQEKITFGFCAKMCAFYAMYDGELSRNRWLAVYASPLFIISLLPLLMANFITLPWLVVASVLNAGLAAGDIMAMVLISRQIPKNATIVQNGWDTYWKEIS